MSKIKFFSSTTILFVSALVLVASGLGLYFLSHPISLAQIFNHHQPGTLTVHQPSSELVNQPFKVDIQMDTAGQAANAVGVYLHFDPQRLQLLNIDTTQSFCQFYPEKKFDNDLGIVSLACGSPHPGVTGKNTVMTLEFLPTAVGATSITTDPKSKILLSDGKGTNILYNPPVINLNILQNL